MISAISLGGSEAPGLRPECHRTRAMRDPRVPGRLPNMADTVPGIFPGGIASNLTGNPASWR